MILHQSIVNWEQNDLEILDNVIKYTLREGNMSLYLIQNIITKIIILVIIFCIRYTDTFSYTIFLVLYFIIFVVTTFVVCCNEDN